MKHALVAFLLLLAGPAAAQSLRLPAGAIVWSASRPLTVADFRGQPPAAGGHAALTSTDINTGASCHNNEFRGTARASFAPAASWVRDPAHITPRLLRHEQLHFDIAEVYARRLRRQLAALPLPCNQLGDQFERLSQRGYAEWEAAEDAYDRDTDHGLLAPQQARWEALVQQQLLELAAWAVEES